jgi:thiol-disulfide isomerase/thioredoxin
MEYNQNLPKMMRIFAILLLFTAVIGFLSCNSQKKGGGAANQVKYDKNAGGRILYGAIDRQAFQKEGFRSWFQAGYSNYQVNSKALSGIAPELLQDMQVEIVLGTWCPDSRREVPHFFKIADALAIGQEQITMLAVDRNFNGPDFEKGQNGVTHVPTFIFQHNGEELGRIVESPQQTLEQDIKQILAP